MDQLTDKDKKELMEERQHLLEEIEHINQELFPPQVKSPTNAWDVIKTMITWVGITLVAILALVAWTQDAKADDKRIARYLSLTQTIVWPNGTISHGTDMIKPYSYNGDPVGSCFNDMTRLALSARRNITSLGAEIVEEWIPDVFGDYASITHTIDGFTVLTSWKCDFLTWNEVPWDLR